MAKKQYDVDLCVIGAGSGGLSLAWVAANLDLNVVLYEADKMGGDCLNHGCVPSKAMIAAGKHAQAFRNGEKFGIKAAEPVIKSIVLSAMKASAHKSSQSARALKMQIQSSPITQKFAQNVLSSAQAHALLLRLSRVWTQWIT